MQLTCEKSLLDTCKTSSLLINTLSGDGKYSLFNRDNLKQAIQMQLSGKQKTFSDLFSPFSESDLNFEHLQKRKMSLIGYVFPKVWTPKNLVRSMSKNSRFKGSFGKQHRKRAQILLRIGWQHLCHIY